MKIVSISENYGNHLGIKAVQITTSIFFRVYVINKTNPKFKARQK